MIIVTTHNGLPLTKACMKTLLAQNGSPPILAIDNASTDGTYRWLKTQPVDSMYGHYGSVSEMWNTALRYAWSQGFDRALVVNNDTKLKPETYELLLAENADMVTAVGVSSENQFSEAIDASNKRSHPDYSCYMISKRAWEIVDGFDESYIGGYGEDAENHLALHRAGINAYCIGIPFFHVASGTLKSVPEAQAQRIRENADRNRQMFKERHGVEIGSPGYYALFSEQVAPVVRAGNE